MAGWSINPYRDAPDLRIGTAERERAAALLTEHLTAGRLELDEFDERSRLAYAARTGSELAALFTDLPGTRPAAHELRGEHPHPGGRRHRRPGLLLIVLVLALIGLATVVSFPPFWIVPLVFVVTRARHRRRYAGYAMAGHGRRR
jgi:hypothetical protein